MSTSFWRYAWRRLQSDSPSPSHNSPLRYTTAASGGLVARARRSLPRAGGERLHWAGGWREKMSGSRTKREQGIQNGCERRCVPVGCASRVGDLSKAIPWIQSGIRGSTPGRGRTLAEVGRKNIAMGIAPGKVERFEVNPGTYDNIKSLYEHAGECGARLVSLAQLTWRWGRLTGPLRRPWSPTGKAAGAP
jgi:hypothetical protein